MSWARSKRERGELGLGSEGGTTLMKLRKLTQLTHEERKSARQRHRRERERLGEMSYDERERERETVKRVKKRLIF